jgi:hypothetical protein
MRADGLAVISSFFHLVLEGDAGAPMSFPQFPVGSDTRSIRQHRLRVRCDFIERSLSNCLPCPPVIE